MCHAPQPAAGKLETLGAKGRACEGSPRKAQGDIQLLAVNPTSTFQLSGSINGFSVSFMPDTGAAVTLLRKDVWDRVKSAQDTLKPWSGPRFVGVEGTPIQIHGTTQVPLRLRGQVLPTQMVVADSLRTSAILGLDFLEENQCVIDTGSKTLQFRGRDLSVKLQSARSDGVSASVSVVMPETVLVPPYSKIEVTAEPNAPLGSETWLVEDRLAERSQLVVANALVKPPPGKAPCVLRIINPTAGAITMHWGMKVAKMEAISNTMIAEVGTECNNEASKPVTEEKQELLRQMVQHTESDLSSTQRDHVFDVLLEFEDVFANAGDNLGHASSIKHQIDTGDAAPIRQPVRRVPPHRREIVQNLLSDMQERNVIQPSKSPWASPIVLVQKKDGSWRFCIDYRKVNAVTRKDAYPLPRIDDTLDTMAGSRWFSTLDLLSGYWQVQVDERDREKTAFCTSKGLFEFRVMPFGLCNAPVTFQRLMNLMVCSSRAVWCISMTSSS